MPNRRTSRGNVQIRDLPDAPGARFEGLALPYGTTIDVPYGKERFVRGAFADMVGSVQGGERIAYLSRHGEDGGVPVGVISALEERDEGLFFSGDFLDVPEAPAARAAIEAGLKGVSVEFVPGKSRRKAGVTEHYSGVRLAGVANSYAPAYREAQVALRSAVRAAGGLGKMPTLSATALTERRDILNKQIVAIRSVAESEDREPDEEEMSELDKLKQRVANITALIAEVEEETKRRDAERAALPQRAATSSPAVVTRSETVYGPGRDHSFFADLMGIANRDAGAGERMARHRSLVEDIAAQVEKRAIDSSQIAGAYPTSYYPDLYIPDIAYTGPLSAFFETTPITAPNPIIVPSFATVTGDTAVQSAENAALANVDVTTAPKTLTPKTIGGESIVSRQAVDGASPGTDVIIGNELRELLMRDTEREIALVLEALTASGTIADTAGTGGAQSGRDLQKGIAAKLGEFYSGAAAGGVGARMLPAQGVFVNSTDWNNLVQGEDTTGRPIMPFINPVNALGEITGASFQKGIIGGVPVEPAWAILDPKNEIIARKADARQWKSAVLDIRLTERNGPQSVVFAIMQYFGFAVLQPKGVRKYTYTNV